MAKDLTVTDGYLTKSPAYNELHDKYTNALAKTKDEAKRKVLSWALRQLEAVASTREGASVCLECEAKTVKYSHTLSKPLIAAMRKMYDRVGMEYENLNNIELTRGQWDNFQKLKYWGLVESKSPNSGVWRITEKGRDFLHAKIKVHKKVYTYRGVVEGFGDEEVLCNEVPENWRERVDYGATATPV